VAYLYSYLNLPKFKPKFELDTSAITFDLSSDQIKTTGLHNARYSRFKVNDQYQDYMVQLIPELSGHIRDIGYQRITNDDSLYGAAQLFPHTDGDRRGRHCIQYLLDTGGDNVRTTWYQESGQPLFRETKKQFANAELTKVSEAVFPLHHWVIFSTSIIHNVEPITTSRQAFTVGFTNDKLFELIVEKYGMFPTVTI
jgi:hypothetical protein